MRLRPALFLALCLAASLPVLAQSPPPDSVRKAADSLSLDSLRARLTRAEAAIAILREQIGDEAESAVHTRSRFHVEISAQILTNAFLTSGRVNNIDVPQTALASPGQSSTPPTNSALGITLRQTRLGAATSVDNVAGATFTGDIDVDFFGGVQTGAGDRRLFPEPHPRDMKNLAHVGAAPGNRSTQTRQPTQPVARCLSASCLLLDLLPQPCRLRRNRSGECNGCA